MDHALDLLRRAVEIVGGPAYFILILLICGSLALYSLYLFLEYRERSVKVFFPLFKTALTALLSEKNNRHPAIRVEYALHTLIIPILFLLLVARFFHAALLAHENPLLVDILIVSFCVVLIGLTCVSVKWASRLH